MLHLIILLLSFSLFLPLSPIISLSLSLCPSLSLYPSSSAEQALAAGQGVCGDLKQRLEQVQTEAQSQRLSMDAQILELSHIKNHLEERLIELIK